MSTELRLPQLENATTVTIARWLKQAGDTIAAREKLLEAYSEHFDWDIPAPKDGMLAAIRAPAGTTANAGEVIAVVELPAVGGPMSAVNAATTDPVCAGRYGRRPPTATPRISPIAARIAAEHRIDLAQVRATSTGGRITKDDVLVHLQQLPTPNSASPTPQSGAREARVGDILPTAQPTVEPSNHPTIQPPNHLTIPHVTTFIEIDMRHVATQRDAMQTAWQWREGFALDYLPFIVQAAIGALRAVPTVNSAFTANGIVVKRRYDIAITGGAVIRNAEQYNLVGLARSVRGTTEIVTTHDATFTIADHSASGALLATGRVAPSQAATLNVGAVTARAVVVGDAIQIRPMVFLSLTYDHRVVDGIVAGQFLSEMRRQLEE